MEKLTKTEIAILCVTALFLTFLAGYFVGHSAHTGVAAVADVQVVTENKAPQSAVTAGIPEKTDEPAQLLDLNSASQQDLEQLTGIGQTLAERIIAYREENGSFASVEELTNVSGIGDGKLAQIRDKITVK